MSVCRVELNWVLAVVLVFSVSPIKSILRRMFVSDECEGSASVMSLHRKR